MRLLILLLAALPGCSPGPPPSPVEEIVAFRSGDVTLEGTLDLPDARGQYPVAIFIHGSGRRTREDYRSFVRPFHAAGLATFRYDKRGVGKSGGSYTDVGTMNSETMFGVLAKDAIAAIDHLKKDPRIDPDRIMVVGASQAGWIIPEISRLCQDVYLSVIISGPLVSVGEEIYYSDLAEHGAYTQAQADSMLQHYRGPKGFEPVSRVVRMKAPSLWIFGGKDVSIPIKRSLAVMDSLRFTNDRIEMKLFPDADHGLYNATTHRPEDAITVIIDWMKPKL